MTAIGATLVPHPLHDRDRVYPATGCYLDLVIELLHWRGFEPVAVLGSLIRLEWERTHFTYAKPRFEDLELLYGMDVHEMLLSLPLPELIEAQLAEGRYIMFEADTYYLPDLVGISYRREHANGQLVVTAIDRAAERIAYFHSTGHHTLEGEDYRGVFHLLEHFTPEVVEQYAELVVFRPGIGARDDAELRRRAGRLLVRHAARRPATNPFTDWGAQLGEDLERLARVREEPPHAYGFVTARQAGSTSELLADHLEWLLGPAGTAVATPLRRIAHVCKALTFRFARRRPFDFASEIAVLAGAWEDAMDALMPFLAGLDTE